MQPLIFALADGLQWDIFVQEKKYIQRVLVPLPEPLTAYDYFEVMPMAPWFADRMLDALGPDYNPYDTMFSYYR